ncbi:hypothetical protein D3X11_01755 [Streptococcus sp. X16XC17]|uniref:Rgg family transcriptional regulator n=1 Tax=unclassified Streptococcus TaxID=2608887 RepID=UPI00066FE239|nr:MULTISPECIES: hypothetical protein [unclassified Streptococcus]TCD46207.1 hypothetical protein D3X11_01755 [Streptococcus sp. X16XC17]
MIFAKPIADNLQEYSQGSSAAIEESIVSNTLFLACLEKRKDIMDEFATVLEKKGFDEQNLISRVFFTFYLGCYYCYLTEQVTKGKSMMQMATRILEQLGCHGRLDYLRQHQKQLREQENLS